MDSSGTTSPKNQQNYNNQIQMQYAGQNGVNSNQNVRNNSGFKSNNHDHLTSNQQFEDYQLGNEIA